MMKLYDNFKNRVKNFFDLRVFESLEILKTKHEIFST
jgi:hypothetical protein